METPSAMYPISSTTGFDVFSAPCKVVGRGGDTVQFDGYFRPVTKYGGHCIVQASSSGTTSAVLYGRVLGPVVQIDGDTRFSIYTRSGIAESQYKGDFTTRLAYPDCV